MRYAHEKEAGERNSDIETTLRYLPPAEATDERVHFGLLGFIFLSSPPAGKASTWLRTEDV